MNKLRQIFDELRSQSVDPSAYSGRLADAAFEIVSADTFIAGIASALLDGRRPSEQEEAILHRDYLIGSSWMTDDGDRIELGAAIELCDYARLVERLKVECLRCLQN